MSCKHLRKSLLRAAKEVGEPQTANCRFKMTGAAKAKELHSKLFEMGFEKSATPGLHCCFYSDQDYSKCPWFTRGPHEEGL